jgi:RNA polymerase sigma-70 factor (ECF subfamily)
MMETNTPCIQFPRRGPAIDPEALYRRYGPMVLRRCRSLLRDEELASDAMQDVFVQLLRKQRQLHGKYPSSLLYRMATNHSLNLLRRGGRRRLVHNEEQLENLPGSSQPEAEVETRDTLERVFAGERTSTRTIATLRHVEGLSLEDTARQVGMSVSGVRKRLDGLRRRSLTLLTA